ncbi:MAG TPA: T9SS type A sorting domain-containing protein [bacterium]|jgi:outer membrane protein assembly factor BamB
MNRFGMFFGVWMVLSLITHVQAQPNVEWAHSYSFNYGTTWNFPTLLHGYATADTGYVLIASDSIANSGSPDSTFRLVLMGTDVSGDTLWTRSYPAQAPRYAARAADGTYVIAGFHGWTCGVSAQGDSLWSRQRSDSCPATCWAMAALSDGGIVIGGESPRAGGGETAALCRLANDGSFLWRRTVDIGYTNTFRAVQETADSGILFAEKSTSTSWQGIIKYNSAGDSLWRCTIQHPQALLSPCEIRLLRSGDCLIAGRENGGMDLGVSCLAPDGTLRWERTLDLASDEYFCCMDTTADGSAVLVSTSGQTDLRIIKINSQGTTLWNTIYNQNWMSVCSFVQSTPDGGFLVGGYFMDSSDNMYLKLLKFSADPNGVQPGASQPTTPALHPAYPNPFNPATTLSFSMPITGTVKVKVFDVTGRLVETLLDRHVEAGEHRLSFDGTALASGLYFARLETGTLSQTQKLMLMK